ncbi:hypothetical protein ACFL10_02140 [Patescibacteria group bacterium]
MDENGSKQGKELSPEVQSAMDAYLGVEAAFEGNKDYSDEFSAEFKAEVEQALADGRLDEEFVQQIYAWDTEPEARLCFEGILEIRAQSAQREALTQDYTQRIEVVLDPDNGMTAEQRITEQERLQAELDEKLTEMNSPEL